MQNSNLWRKAETAQDLSEKKSLPKFTQRDHQSSHNPVFEKKTPVFKKQNRENKIIETKSQLENLHNVENKLK